MLTVWVCNFCQKEISAKAACKLVVKLTTGWSVMDWDEFYDPQNAPVKPGTLVMASHWSSSLGIEAKNVIAAVDKLNITYLDKEMDFHFASNVMLRAVAHLTLLINVSESSEEEVFQFQKKIENVSEIIDLR